jgi:hypothetical protein
MSDLRDLLQSVADTGDLPSNEALKAVINRGYGGSNRPVAEERQSIVRQLAKYCYRIAERREYLDFETANEMAEDGVEAFGQYSKGAEARLDPSGLADEIGRGLAVWEVRPETRQLDTSSVRKIFEKAALTDRPIPSAEVARLDLGPRVSRGSAREQLQEAADRIRSLARRGDTVEANQLADRLAGRLGDVLLDHRAAWPADLEVPDDDPVKLASLIRGDGPA